MIKFRTSCTRCGEVDVPKTSVEFDPAGRYRFRCSQCRQTQERDAGPTVTRMLGAAGVPCVPLRPITEQEIAGFVAGLDRSDWFEMLHSGVRRASG